MTKETNLIFSSLSHSSRPSSSSERCNNRHHHRSPYWSHFAVGHNWNGDSDVPQTPQQQTEWRVSASLPSRAWITAAQQKKSTGLGKSFHQLRKHVCVVIAHKTTACVCVFSVVHPSTNPPHPRRPTALPTR